METRIIDHIDDKFEKVAPSWQMAINAKTHNLVQDAVIILLIVFMLLGITGC